MEQFLMWTLMFVSAIVYIGIRDKKDMWGFIMLYWAILVLKNLWDILN